MCKRTIDRYNNLKIPIYIYIYYFASQKYTVILIKDLQYTCKTLRFKITSFYIASLTWRDGIKIKCCWELVEGLKALS